MCALVVKRSKGERIFGKINGLICVYKPSTMELTDIAQKLKLMFLQTFNKMPCRPIEKMVKVDDQNEKISITQNLADSPLAVGPRFISKDFRIEFLHPLSYESSGIQLCSINDTHELKQRIYNMRLLKVYQIQGRMGVATDNFSPNGKVIEKSTYDHVTRASIDRILSSIQSTYQREMYNYFGLDLKSQKAFDLASSGLLRPVDHKTSPIIYSIKCIKYVKPFITIEITIINEKTMFLKELMHDIGYRLKTNAICTEIKRIRDGFIDVNSSLAHTEWNDFDKILENIRLIKSLTYENLANLNKTILIGQTKHEEVQLINKNSTTSKPGYGMEKNNNEKNNRINKIQQKEVKLKEIY